MKHIVFCWEKGDGLGHLSGFSAVAKELQSQGHKVSWIVANTGSAEALFGGKLGRVYQAPLIHSSVKLTGLAKNFSDILMNTGYADPIYLAGAMRSWSSLISMLKPDLLVCDFAPTAMLANAQDIPTATFSTGFCTPADGGIFQSLQPWGEVPEKVLSKQDSQLYTAISSTLDHFGIRHLAALENLFSGLFSGDESFLTTFDFLDPYTSRTHGTYVGSTVYSEKTAYQHTGLRPSWPQAAGKKIFVYLRGNNSQTPEIIAALKSFGLPTMAYIDGTEEYLSSDNVHIFRSPIDMRYAYSSADAVVCHGGHGMVCSSLLAGTPVLIAPTHLEQLLTAYSLVHRGLGAHLVRGDPLTALLKVFNSPNISHNAHEFSENVKQIELSEVTERLLKIAH